jgi:drug/metabolite transporter (DMT)-like permease
VTPPDQQREQKGPVIASMVALYFIWGSTYLAIRFALPGFPPLLMSGLRFLCAGSLLYSILRLRGEAPPSRIQWFAAFRVGTLLVCGNALVVVAEQWVSSGVTAVAIASVPLWSVLFAGLWGRWPAKREWLGLAVGLAGVALLQSGGEMRASPAGAVVLLFSALTWAFGSMWSRRLPIPKGLMAAATEMLTGGAVLFCAAVLRGERMTALPDARALGAFVYMIIFGSIVAYSAYAFLLAKVRPALATSYAYVNPVVAVLLGAAFAGERVTMLALAALALILAGVAIVAAQGSVSAPAPAQGTESRRTGRLARLELVEPGGGHDKKAEGA